MTATNKQQALETYKATKTNYMHNMTNANWIAFCDAKRTCRLLGVKI